MPPLPNIGPAEFSGGVGNFDISIAPSKTTIETNSTNELVIQIEGAGNLQEVKEPTIVWPKGIEGFTSTLKSQEDKSYFPMRVRKTFTYPFVVNTVGNYTIPPIAFTYYDATNSKYVSKQTAPVNLQVVKGSGNKNILSTV